MPYKSGWKGYDDAPVKRIRNVPERPPITIRRGNETFVFSDRSALLQWLGRLNRHARERQS